MKLLGILFLLFFQVAQGGFGGARSGGFSGGGRSSFGGSRSSFSSSRSSFGGSRSSSTATISRPSSTASAAWYSRSAPTVSHTTVVHEVPVYHNSGGSFWTNFWMYQAITGNRPQPVVVSTPSQTIAGAPVQTATIVEPESHGFFYYFMWTVVWVACIGGVVYVIRRVIA